LYLAISSACVSSAITIYLFRKAFLEQMTIKDQRSGWDMVSPLSNFVEVVLKRVIFSQCTIKDCIYTLII